jgi:hypothetical protein
MRQNTEPDHQDLSTTEVAHIIEIDPAADTLTEILKATSDAISGLLNTDELEFPCHCAIVASNGWSSIIRYTGKPGEAITLAEHDEPPGVQLPIHYLLMDSGGWTARVIVRAKPRGH